MVSFQNSTPQSPKESGAIAQGLESLSKKRKWEETQPLRRGQQREVAEEPFWKRPSPLSETREAARTVLDIELHLETPLPWEWQRYLDIQSGQVHFYNTRTHKKTSKDPRETSDAGRPTSPSRHVSLDLELNLPYNHDQQDDHEDLFSRTTTRDPGNLSEKESGWQVKKVRSWLGLETRNETEGVGEEEEDEEAEKEEEDHMVATVCARCHLLVMLCKSSPTCPNCKYLHPPDQSRRTLFKGRCSLLC